MKPAWLKLTEQWQDAGHFGLTIPFLVGALQNWPGGRFGEAKGIEQLRLLLNSVRDDAPDNTIMRLYSCDRINDLALAPIGGVPQHCFAVQSPELSSPSLYVEIGTVPNGGTSFDELVSALWLRYRIDIEACRFSRRDGSFHPFDASDVELILKAATRPDDDV